jgi:hypothetical protein
MAGDGLYFVMSVLTLLISQRLKLVQGLQLDEAHVAPQLGPHLADQPCRPTVFPTPKVVPKISPLVPNWARQQTVLSLSCFYSVQFATFNQ